MLNHPRPWHQNSVFGDGPRRPLDREQRAVWKARLNLFRRAGKLTPLFEDIGLAMLKRLGADGRLDPSQQTLADDVGCNVKSVQRALEAFQSCGLMLWVRRLVRDGWRVAQTSNAYALTIGKPPLIPVLACDGQKVRQTIQESFSTATPAEIAAAQAALARRRAVVEQRLLGKAV